MKFLSDPAALLGLSEEISYPSLIWIPARFPVGKTSIVCRLIDRGSTEKI